MDECRAKIIRGLALGAGTCVMFLSGCTVTTTSQRVSLGLPVDTAKTYDGTTAGLWRNQGLYALTVRDLPALQLPAVTSAKIADIRRASLATNVLIEASDPKCQYRYLLYSVRAASVRNWEMGDCRTPVRVTMEEERQVFNFYSRDQRLMFEFKDDRVFESVRGITPSATVPSRAQTASSIEAAQAKPGAPVSVTAVSQISAVKGPDAAPVEKIPVVIDLRR